VDVAQHLASLDGPRQVWLATDSLLLLLKYPGFRTGSGHAAVTVSLYVNIRSVTGLTKIRTSSRCCPIRLYRHASIQAPECLPRVTRSDRLGLACNCNAVRCDVAYRPTQRDICCFVLTFTTLGLLFHCWCFYFSP